MIPEIISEIREFYETHPRLCSFVLPDDNVDIFVAEMYDGKLTVTKGKVSPATTGNNLVVHTWNDRRMIWPLEIIMAIQPIKTPKSGVTHVVYLIPDWEGRSDLP